MVPSEGRAAEVAPSLASLDAHVALRIRSATLVIDAAAAVREAVENSLDAGATRVEVALDLERFAFSVRDNGKLACRCPCVRSARNMHGACLACVRARVSLRAHAGLAARSSCSSRARYVP
jgi:LytS/YehU family sensor histidine kinase